MYASTENLVQGLCTKIKMWEVNPPPLKAKHFCCCEIKILEIKVNLYKLGYMKKIELFHENNENKNPF